MPAPPPAEQPGSPEDLVRVLRAEGVRDRRVLAAFRAVPRAGLVPPAAAGLAYVDAPIRIPHGQVTTQPSLIASMVQALHLSGSERVLEVGTGLGFQTAILALLAREVVSVERFADLAAQGRANLAAAGLGHVTVVVGDGALGVPEHAPYQAIVVAAASPRVPPPLVEQLAPGGRLVHPVGPGGHEQVTAFHREDGSGRPVPVAGGAALQVIINAPALGHDSHGYVGKVLAEPRADFYTPAQLAGWSSLREVRYAGSFEGQTTIAVGVRARVPFRVFTVLDPSGDYRSVVLDLAP